MKNTAVKTYLPLFLGFYETIFSYDNETMEQYNQVEDNYCENVAESACNFIGVFLSEYVNSVKLEKVNSPSYYNFSNDCIWCDIEPNIESIDAYLKKNWVAFEAYIKENYTSYDGFISFYENDATLFYDENALSDKHKLGSILQFICENEDITTNDMYEFVVPNVF